jgi:surface polysaccharide O-acyltransferase-like enzyme
MSPEEVSMTEAESMQLISSMINKAKNRFNETGFLYLLWGWVVLICCITQFVAAYFFNYGNAYYVWFLTWIVVVYQVFFLRKKRKSRTTLTNRGNILLAVCSSITLY